MKIGTWTIWESEEPSKVIVISYGPDVDRIIAKAKVNNKHITIVNARFFKPIDEEMLVTLIQRKLPIIIYETDMLCGGLSDAILSYCNDNQITKQFIRIGLEDHFVEHGSLPQLRKAEHIDTNSLFEVISQYD